MNRYKTVIAEKVKQGNCNSDSGNKADQSCKVDTDCNGVGANPNHACVDKTTKGNDSAVFKCGKNSEGKTTYEKQGSAFVLSGDLIVCIGGANNGIKCTVPADCPGGDCGGGDVVRVTGYGIDGNEGDPGGANAACTCDPAAAKGTRNTILQTDFQVLLAGGPQANRLNHQVDTCGANSGSPIFFYTGDPLRAIGIHTNAGCLNPVAQSSNAGTAVTNAVLKAAIVKLLGKETPGACCAAADNQCSQLMENECKDLGKGYVFRGPGTPCGPDGTCIPTVSEWGLAVMTLLVLTAATVVIMRRRAAVERAKWGSA